MSEQDPEEQPPEEPRNYLTQETVAEGLSQIAKTFDGASYAYTTLTIESKEVEELGDLLGMYSHLRYLNLSKNAIKDVREVAKLTYLLDLQASENQIESIEFLSNNDL